MNTEDDEFARIAREQALNKMADNARELGLDYELPITMQAGELDCTHAERLCVELKLAEQPAQQEPVAWMWVVDGKPKTVSFGGANSNTPKEWAVLPLYTSPPAQRTWVGLTDEEVWDLWNSYTEEPFPEWFVDFKRSYKVLEAKLKELNT